MMQKLSLNLSKRVPSLSSHLIRSYASSKRVNASDKITIKWKKPDGTIIPTTAEVGTSLLITAHRNEIDLEGACEGVCACSTCHVILEEDVFDDLPVPSEDEEDMLGTPIFI
jgi:ferredoxin